MPLQYSNTIVHERGGTTYNVGEELEALFASLTALSAVLNAPSGTRILFQQTAAPTGWTKDTSHNNKALRVVSGTVSSGGTTAFTDVFANRTITQANLPNVTLTVTGSVSSTTTLTNGTSVFRNVNDGIPYFVMSNSSGYFRQQATITASTTSTFSGGATSSLNGGVAQTAVDFAVQYVDIIFCQKD